MKIVRDGKEYELTKDELYSAYLEQEAIYDQANIRNNMEGYLSSDEFVRLKNNESFIECAADKLRENQDDYNMGYDDALASAFDEAVKEFYPSTFTELRNYDEAFECLLGALASADGVDIKDVFDSDKDIMEPLFMSTNYFGIYCYRDGSNEYYLVDKNSGEHKMVLGDSFAFVGKNLLDCMKNEKVLHISNKEFVRYLIDFSYDNVKDLLPVEELRGIAVLDAALREAFEKEGYFYVKPSLAERISSAAELKEREEAESKDREKVFSIKDIATGLYVTEESDGEYKLGEASDRLLFYNESEVENLLNKLNDTFDLCFTLVDETPAQYMGQDLGR